MYRPLDILSGVSQGSTLDPLLFNVFTAKISTILSHRRYHVYTDDIQLYYSSLSNDVNIANISITKDIVVLMQSASKHNLIINPANSTIMLLGGRVQRARLVGALDIRVVGQRLQVYESARNLNHG